MSIYGLKNGWEEACIGSCIEENGSDVQNAYTVGEKNTKDLVSLVAKIAVTHHVTRVDRHLFSPLVQTYLNLSNHSIFSPPPNTQNLNTHQRSQTCQPTRRQKSAEEDGRRRENGVCRVMWKKKRSTSTLQTKSGAFLSRRMQKQTKREKVIGVVFGIHPLND